MDFIFEEDMDEVGSDIEAYCPKCKADTAHTVITKYEDEVRRVQCSTCGDVHAYRKPRGEVEDEVPEPVAAKKRAAAKKPTWQEWIDKVGQNKANHLSRPYTIREHYHEGDVVSHPKFGIGIVTEISENKAEVTFQDERRVLVHNRPDLAAQMPAIAPTPIPRAEKTKGKKGGAKGKAAEPEKPAKVAEAPAARGKGAAAAAAVAPAAVVTAGKDKPGASKLPIKKAAEPPAAASKRPSSAPPPPQPVQGKAARAQAAVQKKAGAKATKSAPPAKAAPPAKVAAPPSKPAAAAARPKVAARGAAASKSAAASRVRRPEPAKTKVKARR